MAKKQLLSWRLVLLRKYGIREDDIVKEIAQLLNIALTRRTKKSKKLTLKIHT